MTDSFATRDTLEVNGKKYAIATRGSADMQAIRSSLGSIFRTDADRSADLFDGVGNLRLGLETLIAQLDDRKRDLSTTRIAVSVLRLERRVSARAQTLRDLRAGTEAIAAQMGEAGVTDNEAIARMARLYVDNISRLQPRIVVEGNPQFLQHAPRVEQVRALLLAALYAAGVWHQLGGTQLRLLFRRRQYAMLARGMLAQCTLSGS